MTDYIVCTELEGAMTYVNAKYFSRDFMDDLFDMPQRTYAKSYSANGLMKTDIKESEEGFTVEMDLPGFCREDISAELKDGYLTVTATAKKAEENTSDKKEKYVQKERFHATCNRSFYVGDNMKQEDIKAKFENGVLTLQVPKKEEIPEEQTKKFITIG